MNLTTCLWFNGQAREAAQFYTSIFPNSSMGSNWIAPTETPGNEQGDEVYVDFTIFGQPFIGLNGGPQFPHSEAISFQIPCKDQTEIDKFWEISLVWQGADEFAKQIGEDGRPVQQSQQLRERNKSFPTMTTVRSRTLPHILLQ